MIRVGHSWDTHKLVQGRRLILGGVEFKDAKLGLLGHSDADCVLHSIAEALLGSLALGDLGELFPDTSADTLNMDSRVILSKCYELVKAKGYELINCDIMIYSEFIKISPYKEVMRKRNDIKIDVIQLGNSDKLACLAEATGGEFKKVDGSKQKFEAAFETSFNVPKGTVSDARTYNEKIIKPKRIKKCSNNQPITTSRQQFSTRRPPIASNREPLASNYKFVNYEEN